MRPPFENRRRTALKVQEINRAPLSPYGFRHYAEMASALRVEPGKVEACKLKFAHAALWLRQDRRSPRKAPPSSVLKKIESVEASARKLLHHLGIRHLREAPDGPGDEEVLNYLASAHEGDPTGEDAVIIATERIGRLGEIIDAAKAAWEIERRAKKGVKDVVRLGKLIGTEGHVGDAAVNNWIACMLLIYEEITGKQPGTSVGAPTRRNEGRASGPLIAFLAAAGRPLEIEMSPDAWRKRVRDLRGAQSRRK
jgi:hypothetical protein